MLSFLITGYLHSDYERVGGLLGFPAYSCTQWSRIVKKLEEFVSDLAEWSFSQVRNEVKERGDDKEWITSFDKFYLTRGHYSNNSSVTLYDYSTGKVAWFAHRTKRGPGHNWLGTSAGTDTDMLDELFGRAKGEVFTVKELICDKNSATNATSQKPTAETTHQEPAQVFGKIKKYKCEVIKYLAQLV